MHQEIEDIFYELLAKEMAGELSSAEAEELDVLVSKHPELEAIRESSLSDVFTFDAHKFDSSKGLASVHKKIDQPRRITMWSRPQVFRWAAVFVIALSTILYLTIGQQNTVEQIVMGPFGADSTINMKDGSTVSLRAGGTLTYDSDFGATNRTVAVTGEAFFDIFRDTLNPFVVKADETEITVLGTSFFVSQTQNATEVIVESGIVDVESVKTGESVVLKKGESAKVNKLSNALERVSVDKNDLFWFTKKLQFRRSDLKTVVEKVNQKYNSHLELKNEDLANCELTVTFTNQSVEDVANVIAMTLGLDTLMTLDTIYLDGQACK